jgi:hypothetical protein
MKFHHITIAATTIATFISLVFAQSEGNTVQQGGIATASSGTYSCDPNVCKIANGCVCASKNPPNGLSPNDTPQFVTVTFDDSIQPQLYKTAKRMLNVTYVASLFIYMY